MRLIAFPQWDKLMSLLRGMARQSAADYAQRNIVRIIPKNGVAHLANYAANLLAVEGGKTTIVIPDIVPGKACDFMLRVTASGENELLFTGASPSRDLNHKRTRPNKSRNRPTFVNTARLNYGTIWPQ